MKNFKAVILFLALILFLVLNSVTAKADVDIPKPTALKYSNDYIDLLDQSTEEYLVSVGKELEAKTGAQAVVVIINSLQANSIESYAYDLFRNWQIGQKEKNNGLLILLSIEDRRWKVEVGRGLEGAITDISSARVMENLAVPSFRAGNYGEGIKAAYSSYADSIAKEYGVTLEKNVTPITRSGDNYTRTSGNNPFGLFLILGFIFIDLIFNRGRLTRFMMRVMFWSSLGRGRRGGNNRGGGGYGGFGGGKSGGGGSSGGW